MRTHVSSGGCLFRTGPRILQAPSGASLVGFGRHVNPNGDYNGAPHVALYRTASGWVCV